MLTNDTGGPEILARTAVTCKYEMIEQGLSIIGLMLEVIGYFSGTFYQKYKIK